MKGNLKAAELDRWVKAGEPIAGKSDGGGLTWTFSGKTASWVFRYRHAGKQREMTLGNYPDLALEKAREAARAARVMVDLGKDVAGEKRRVKAEAAAARTFREITEEYLDGRKKIAETTRHEWRRYMDKDIYPAIGSIAISDLQDGVEVRSLVKRIATRSKAVARRVFEMVSVVFTHAIGDGSATTNPCKNLKVSALVGEQERRERVMLERDELTLLLASAPALGRANELMLKILLATCVRKGELVKAEKADVDLAARLWTVPDENSKTRKGYTIPLAPVVAEWFRELISYSGSSTWVLPARNGRRYDKHVHERTINAALSNARLGIRHFTPHDLRSTARSYLTAKPPKGLGMDLVVAERCLNHALGGLVSVYDKHDYLDERREALEEWANYLAELEGKTSNVVPLRAAA